MLFDAIGDARPCADRRTERNYRRRRARRLTGGTGKVLCKIRRNRIAPLVRRIGILAGFVRFRPGSPCRLAALTPYAFVAPAARMRHAQGGAVERVPSCRSHSDRHGSAPSCSIALASRGGTALLRADSSGARAEVASLHAHRVTCLPGRLAVERTRAFLRARNPQASSRRRRTNGLPAARACTESPITAASNAASKRPVSMPVARYRDAAALAACGVPLVTFTPGSATLSIQVLAGDGRARGARGRSGLQSSFRGIAGSSRRSSGRPRCRRSASRPPRRHSRPDERAQGDASCRRAPSRAR
ncbi:hypothetical protein X946_76 [Burkholderia sp. ABCPW 111]|nr:hypothetical protein X946_76 [Burkholderia sp. ABCPW 111]